jgi:hypothetical protein
MSLTRRDYDALYLPFKKGPCGTSNYPIISNVAISQLGVVTWTTDIASTSQVHYGTTPNLGPYSPYDATLVTSHSVTLSDLVAGTLYYIKVQSFYLDSLSISDLYTFIYNPVTGDILLEDGTYILLEDGTKIAVEPNP